MLKFRTLIFVCLFCLGLIPSHAQVSFSEGVARLNWPFESSFYISNGNATGGWQMTCGHNCNLHKDGDLYAQDWVIRGCGVKVSTCGQKLLAPFDGKVIHIESNPTGYGLQILLQSIENEQYVMRFAHLQETNVSSGEIVLSGDLIAYVGDTGGGGCHTHFALYRNVLDTIPGTQETYLTNLFNGGKYRPPFIEIGTPFVFSAKNELLDLDIDLGYTSYFIREQNTISGTIKNNSLYNSRELNLVLFAEDLNAKNGLSRELWNEVLEVGPEEEVPFIIEDAFEEEGFYKVDLVYQTLQEERRCDFDTLLTRRLHVVKQDDCLALNEPNDQLEDAFEIDIPKGTNRAIVLESYFSTLDKEKDVDYFKLNFEDAGFLQLDDRNVSPYNKASLTLTFDQGTFDRTDLRKGITIPANSSVIIKAERNLFEQTCIKYILPLQWKPEGANIVFPNPNLGQFTIFVEQDQQPHKVQIYNATGQEVFRNDNLLSENFSLNLDLDLASGLYFLVWENSIGTKNTRSFTIQ